MQYTEDLKKIKTKKAKQNQKNSSHNFFPFQDQFYLGAPECVRSLKKFHSHSAEEEP